MRKRSIKGKIRSIIREHKTLDYYYSCFEKRHDADVCEFVRGQSFSTFKIEDSENCNNKDKKLVYYIKSGNVYSGFGAEFRRTLDALYFAWYYGFVPVIEYNKEYIYSEKEPINGTDNPYEYYFLQPSIISRREVNKYKYILFREEHRRLAYRDFNITSPYEVSDAYINAMGNIVKKFVHLNPTITDYLKKSFKKMGFLDSEILGIHYRGTDFKEGRKLHPKMIQIDKYLDAVDRIIENSKTDIKIFLATDDQAAITEFLKRYNDKVVFFNDTFRSQDGAPVHFSKSERKFHRYTLGLEILQDIIALSKCDYLIAGLSQVSFCARIFKISRGEKYKNKIILENGII